MPTKRDLPHIHVPTEPWRTREEYVPHGGGGPSKSPGPPASGRPAHGEALKDAIKDATDQAARRRDAATFDVAGATPGVYLEFVSFPGWELALRSMENRRPRDPRRRVELVAVTEHVEGGDVALRTQRATVFVPDGEIGHFLTQLEEYADTTPKAPRERRERGA